MKLGEEDFWSSILTVAKAALAVAKVAKTFGLPTPAETTRAESLGLFSLR
ncbi:hypothetical protein RMSM_04775 [Rhodopirellula maiorica SM1]|uniref:Uncharacterized protein n=1 Tax=Rhodopirellula maiorica SM1 TaxID=1265738 RepID=M5RG41_9BACT|nr:hypothetical protein RMSM_04775 [Rhodopirellula maiorica SM1]